MTEIIDLPDDVLGEIFLRVSPQSLNPLYETCRSFRHLLSTAARKGYWGYLEIRFVLHQAFKFKWTDASQLVVDLDPTSTNPKNASFLSWVRRRARGFDRIYINVAVPLDLAPGDALPMRHVIEWVEPIFRETLPRDPHPGPALASSALQRIELKADRFVSYEDYTRLIECLRSIERGVVFTVGLDDLPEASGPETLPTAIRDLQSLPNLAELSLWTPLVPDLDYLALLRPLENLRAVAIGNWTSDRGLQGPSMEVLTALTQLETIEWFPSLVPAQVDAFLPKLAALKLRHLTLANSNLDSYTSLNRHLTSLTTLSCLILRVEDNHDPLAGFSPLSTLPPLLLPPSCASLTLELLPSAERTKIVFGSALEQEDSPLTDLELVVDDVSQGQEARNSVLDFVVGPQLGRLTNLKSLRIEGTDLVRSRLMISLPKELSCLTALTTLHVSGSDAGGVVFPKGALPRHFQFEHLATNYGQLVYGAAEEVEAVLGVDEEIVNPFPIPPPANPLLPIVESDSDSEGEGGPGGGAGAAGGETSSSESGGSGASGSDSEGGGGPGGMMTGGPLLDDSDTPDSFSQRLLGAANNLVDILLEHPAVPILAGDRGMDRWPNDLDPATLSPFETPQQLLSFLVDWMRPSWAFSRHMIEFADGLADRWEHLAPSHRAAVEVLRGRINAHLQHFRGGGGAGPSSRG